MKKDKKSLFDYKLGELHKEDMFNGVMQGPSKLVKIGYTFQDVNGTQMEAALKHNDFIEEEEDYHDEE